MAIDRIPGVGPTNTDVANAVAAVVPTNASIAAAVPTNSSIANAVAAAVPTNTSIANAVAAAVPTNASITNIVQTYSAGPTTFNRVAILTTSQTWNHPDGASANNARRVQVLVMGGGGGGGAGMAADNGSGNNAGGAGGGSGYAVFAQTYVTGSVSVTVGAGGNGGAGQNASKGNLASFGTDGNNGGYSAFGNITASGGYYGAGNYDPTGGTQTGSIYGIGGVSNAYYYWNSFANSTNLSHRKWACRGGSGGGYGIGITSNVFGMESWSNSNILPNAASPTYPWSTWKSAFPHGGSFGNHAGYQKQGASIPTDPVTFTDTFAFGGVGSNQAQVFGAYVNSTSHPGFFGWGINTVAGETGMYWATSTNAGILQNFRDVPLPIGQLQSGGGSMGYGGASATLGANGLVGGIGLLGNGGAGGTSNTQSPNNTTLARSAGAGGSAANNGYGGGGGGGSSSFSNGSAANCTSGSGGAGGPGVVVVFY